MPEKGAEGVIVSQGANIGGWSLYAKDGKLKYCYNWGGFKHFFVEGSTPIPAGDHQVRMEFAYAGGGLGKGGKATLFVDGKKVGEGEIGATLAMVFSADDGCDVGEDSGAPVSPDYGAAGQRLQRTRQGRAVGHCRGRRESRSPDLAGGGRPSGDGETVGTRRQDLSPGGGPSDGARHPESTAPAPSPRRPSKETQPFVITDRCS